MAGKDNQKEDKDGTEPNISQDPTEDDQNVDATVAVAEEYVFLDSKLDELNSALDFIEQKNNFIQEKLKQLLQSNIDMREQLRNENNVTEKKD